MKHSLRLRLLQRVAITTDDDLLVDGLDLAAMKEFPRTASLFNDVGKVSVSLRASEVVSGDRNRIA